MPAPCPVSAVMPASSRPALQQAASISEPFGYRSLKRGAPGSTAVRLTARREPPCRFEFFARETFRRHAEPAVPTQFGDPLLQLLHELLRQAAVGEHARLTKNGTQVRAGPE